MDKDYILKVKGLYHQFLLGNNKTLQVLKNVSLSASRGEFISILGISGSGKSTLLKCISSLLEPTSGEVILNGINPYKIRNAKLSSIRRNEVSFIFQAYNLIPSLPVIENIALPLRLSQKKLTIKNVENLLKRMKFNAGLNDFVGTLSGGEQQKVAIARAVIADSDIIFADEPTGALDSVLDSVSREVIFELLRELVGAGKCVIMVTHDIELASKTDRALILKDGKIFKELHRPSGEELYKILEVQSTTEE
ncbi:ABC transporter ATP-binding protein [Streptococcus pneumoniae]|uniref:ABC transporter ATP-binding protein n=1 Tax=Streptococcus pneumoniae TaxID=1313 RepID=UPI0005DB1A48|nr:ABC transporter ATP-binding protein [Streptococcus pneumoniae]CEZ50438.1 ABC transporter ATP-binding protein [Streptococcus pneumoniae]COL16636.1 ABC transporter ATP-binding protein [Streptococcus pneumoniae]COQ04630.1 ABC transporter ATP-binding protein [Streptococcus pneumoniae]